MITRWWAHHTLTPTKAAGDDLQTLRRLRNALEPDNFHDILLGVTSGYLSEPTPDHHRPSTQTKPALARTDSSPHGA